MDITAQEMLNGSGFDEVFMLSKAERELNRVKECKDLNMIHDHLINFSITIALCVDWIFHLKLSGTPVWRGKNEKHLANWIRTQSDQVAVFIDIANECKHANRAYSNFIAQKIHFSVIEDISAAKAYADAGKGVYRNMNGERKVFILVTVKYNDKQNVFIDVAERALEWFKNLDIELAQPVNHGDLRN